MTSEPQLILQGTIQKQRMYTWAGPYDSKVVATDKVIGRLINNGRDRDVAPILRVFRDQDVADEEPETLNLACGCCGVHKLALTHTNTVAIIDIRVVAEPNRKLVSPLTIDLDSTICETYGLAKEGARHHGYTGARGYHPLLAIAAGTGEVLMSRLREGRANTAQWRRPLLA